MLATNPTTTGEATAHHVAELLRGRVSITRLASGLPVGADLEHADEVTLGRAFAGRQRGRLATAQSGSQRLAALARSVAATRSAPTGTATSPASEQIRSRELAGPPAACRSSPIDPRLTPRRRQVRIVCERSMLDRRLTIERAPREPRWILPHG